MSSQQKVYFRPSGRNGGAAPSHPSPPDVGQRHIPNVALPELLQQYEPVNISPEGYIVVRERPQLFTERPSPLDFQEIGTTGATSYGAWWIEDYNPNLRGHAGLRKYDEMRRSDAQVRASLRLLKTPILGGRWFMQPASNSTRDKNVANFVWRCLTEFMSISWNQIISEALLMLDFGHYIFEPVFEERIIDGTLRIVWKKWGPRHPFQVYWWWFDENGGPQSIDFLAVSGDGIQQLVNIPIDKLVVFTNDKEAGNIRGISILRSAYKHFYFKDNLYKIDAIQKERHGIGIPIIILPLNFNKKDARLADEIGRNLRVNEKAHVVLPTGWEVSFAKLEGQPVDAVASIEHHNKQIMSNILGSFVDRTSGTGGAITADIDLFMHASQYVADTFADTINKYAIPRLVDYNYSRVGYPRLRMRRLGENWRDLSFTIRNFIGADVIRPDDRLEEYVRDNMDLPIKDEGSDRVLELQQRQQVVQDLQLEMQQEQVDAQVEAQKQQQEVQKQTPGQLPNQPNRPKSQGAQPGLPRQAPAAQVNTGSKRVGGPTNNSA